MEGRLLAGRFRLSEMLGKGGMGAVWRAQHLELGVDVAVKLMDPSLAETNEGLARFRREAQAAASLKSPHVVQVFDYGIDGDTPFIAMELLHGESLAKRIERCGQLSLCDTSRILSQVAKALTKAHDAGIVHRDLKPENIFLVPDEDGEIAKVLDFGIAKCKDTSSSVADAVQTQTGAMLGTPYYMSPEQAGGKRDLDHRTDIWSFGVIACECLTGCRVFNGDSLGGLVLAICMDPMPKPSLIAAVPPGFDEWFAQCVARERLDRFQTMREAASTLDALRCHVGLTTSTLSVQATTSPTPRQTAAAVAVSTRSGPTSITLAHPRQSGRSKLLGIGAAVAIVAAALGSWLQLRSPKAAPNENASTALTQVTRAPATQSTPALALPAAPATTTALPAPKASSPATRAMSVQKLSARTTVAAASAQPRTVAPATVAQPTRRTTSIDLAF